MDHRVPLNKGGAMLDIDNLELAHISCNSSRHDNPVTNATRKQSRDYGSPKGLD